MSNSTSSITVCAVGDLILEREDPDSAFDYVSKALESGDLRFGNCEAVYQPGAWGGGIGSRPECFSAIVDAGFGVMSLANNHFYDWGIEGLNNSLELFRKHNVVPVGAGANLTEAWTPVVIDVNGTRVAFVACATVFPPGAAATNTKPGCAGVRVYTVYQGEPGQPGTRPEIKTFVEPQDEAVLAAAVERAKSEADLVILSCHWGIHQSGVIIADYERRLGQVAIDAGADVVVGHHQHILKGVEVYRGGVILHGLGNFVCDLRIASKLTPEQLRERERKYGEYGVAPRDDYPAYPFHPDARNTVIARIRAGGGERVEVELLPCHINPAGQPVLLTTEDPQFEVAVEYIQRITREAELPAEFEIGRRSIEGPNRLTQSGRVTRG